MAGYLLLLEDVKFSRTVREIVNFSLKTKKCRYSKDCGIWKYTNALSGLKLYYNHSCHRSTQMKHVQVNSFNTFLVYEKKTAHKHLLKTKYLAFRF